MLLRYHYITALSFSEPVEDQYFSLLCIPAQTERQQLLDVNIHVEPEVLVGRDSDGLGNLKVYGVLREPHAEFRLSSSGLAETKPVLYEEYEDPESIDLFRYRVPSAFTAPGPDLYALFHAWKDDEPEDVYEKMLYYLKRVHDQLRYDSSATDVRTSAEDAVKIGAGVCQDYSHVLLSLLRMAGMPARYVVGLMQGEGESHAWVEANCRGYWYGIDPTNHLLINESYIKLAHGRDYGDCMISRGIFRNPRAIQTMDVSVSVNPVTPDCE